MALTISSIQQVPLTEAIQPGGREGKPGEFGEALQTAISRIEASRSSATAKVERFLAGEQEELHSVVLATQRAELEFELMVQVRNKVIQAYQEIMRTQV